MVMASAQLGCGPPHNPQPTFSTLCICSQALRANPLFPPPPTLFDCQAYSAFEHEKFHDGTSSLLSVGAIAILVGGLIEDLAFLGAGGPINLARRGGDPRTG